MSRRSVIEEAFTRLLISERIFTEHSIAASLGSMKDLRGHYVFRHNSDDCAFDDDPNNNGKNSFSRSLSENGLLFGTKKRISRSGNSSPEHKRRKSVTFADSNGGDLVQVREFDNNVDPIQNCLSDPVRQNSDTSSPRYLLLFSQPCANYTAFMRQLFTQKVCLENAQIISEDVLIGTIKVQNLAFEKHVSVRVTMDSWKSYHDVQAKFLHSETSDIDVFTFRLHIPSDVVKVQFCLRFHCGGDEYWDNNNHFNYCVIARDNEFNCNYINKR